MRWNPLLLVGAVIGVIAAFAFARVRAARGKERAA